MVRGGRPILLDILDQPDHIGLLLLLLHDLYRANFENRVRGAGVARWRT